jgi:PAS domain S-box-containing protein
LLDLPFPRKLTVMLCAFVLVILCLLALSYRTIEDLSAARAYVGGEGLWSKAQKEAVYDLLRYSISHSGNDFDSYQKDLLVPLGDKQARLELQKPAPQMAVVRRGFIQGRNDPQDIQGMAALFRRYCKSSYMADAISIWEQGDRLIDQLQKLGEELHREVSSGKPNPARVEEIAQQIDDTGAQLTPLEDRFSYSLGAGARRAKRAFLLVTFSATALSLLGGVLFIFLVGRRIRQSEQRYRHLFDAANDAILAIDVQSGAVFEANARSSEFLGVPSDQIVGARAEGFFAASDHELYRRMIRAASAGSSVPGEELHLKNSNGGELAVEVNAVVTEVAGKKIVQGVFRDIRERKRLEEESRQTQKLEVVSRLVAGIAHDFNNLLMVVLTQLSRIQRAPKMELMAHPAEIARVAAEKAVSLSRQLLSFGRSQVLVTEVLDLNQLLREVVAMLPTLPSERVQLTIDLSSESLPVKVDAGKIEQVVMNLAMNACDAMPRGGTLIIRSRRASRPAPGTLSSGDSQPYATLEVSDTGSGMDADTKGHLFEPFFTTKPLGKGSGLGLSTAYGIVKQSGGFFEVESSPGGGSRFRVYLPMISERALLHEVRKRSVSTLLGSETVLLAEDQPAIRDVLREFLESQGYRVLEAQNGNEAFEIAKNYAGPIHVLVTDVIMPQLRGRELAKLLTELHPGICVVLMSGYSEEALIENQLLGEGSVFLIQKPFTPEELAERIRDCLTNQRAPRTKD